MLNRKNKIKVFVVVLSCLVCLTISLACLSVNVNAETLWGSQSSSFQFSNISGTNLPAGNVQLFTYSDWINVPFDKFNYSRDYYFNGDFESVIPVQVQFPAAWAGRYITGRFSVSYTLSHPVQFFYQSNQTFAQSVFGDYTERYQIFIDNENVTEGLTVTVAPTGDSGSSDYIVVNYVFNDFYVPISAASNTSYRFGFDLKYHFSFNASYHKTGTNDYEPGVLTALTSNCQLVSPSVHAGAVMNGGSVQLDNSYYTLIQALYESDITTLLTGIDNYLSAWIGTNPQLITNNWEDFSATIINTLGNIAALEGSASPLIPAINQIYSLLFNAMDQAGYLTTWFTNFYNVMDSQDDHLSNIDSELSTQYTRSLGTYLANVYFALTGWNDTVGNGVSQGTLNAKMNNRWKEIIKLGLQEYFGNTNVVSAAEATQVESQQEDISTVLSDSEVYEDQVYTSAMAQFQTFKDAGFFRVSQDVLPSSVWFVAAVENIFSNMGILNVLITVSFTCGIAVLILGRINRFPLPKDPSA